MLIFVVCTGLLLAVIHLLQRRESAVKLPRIDEIALHYLGESEHVDPHRYYVVVVVIDPGIFMAYCEKRRSPEILEFEELHEARDAATDASRDPEGEVFCCVLHGREDYLAIFNNGAEL